MQNRMVELERGVYQKKKTRRVARTTSVSAAGAAALKAAGIGWKVFDEATKRAGSVSYTLAHMQGHKTPWEMKDKFPIKNMNKGELTARASMWTRGKLDEISAAFTVKFEYDGHSVGNVEMLAKNTEGSWLGWDLDVEASIMPDSTAYAMKTGESPCAAVRVTLTYRFSHTLHDDSIFREVFTLYGNGQNDAERTWTQ